MIGRRLRHALLAVLAVLISGIALTAAAQDRLQADVREAVVRVPAEVQDALGKNVSGELLVTTFRPPGPGPFPLAIISHGRSMDRRADYKRQRFESAARYFVRKGFAVAVPLRLGYGELAEVGDPEDTADCELTHLGRSLQAAAAQIMAVRDFMHRQPDIDTRRTVLVGVSVGGIASIAAAAVHLPDQVAVINFAGGQGGDPDKHPGEPARSDVLRQLYRSYAEDNARQAPPTPTLWVYAENDRYFSPRHARRWAKAYGEAGGAVELRVVPAFGNDGHTLFTAGNDVWQPLVDDFLKPLGFDKPGRLQSLAVRQPLAGAASAPQGQLAGFQLFLAGQAPRAFASGSDGRWGYAQGDDALSRALAICQRPFASTAEGPSPKSCHLYAVDDAVVRSTP